MVFFFLDVGLGFFVLARPLALVFSRDYDSPHVIFEAVRRLKGL